MVWTVSKYSGWYGFDRPVSVVEEKIGLVQETTVGDFTIKSSVLIHRTYILRQCSISLFYSIGCTKIVMAPQQNNATVVSFQQLSGCLFRIWVRPDWDPSELIWNPGQFIRLGVLDSLSDKNSLRPMTITGLEDAVFEFFMVAVSNGVTSSVVATLRPGDRCCLEPSVAGNFHSGNLPTGPDVDLWMMGTGTGIAPYLAMLRYSKDRLTQFRNLILVHSVREEEHLCTSAWLDSLTEGYSAFQYVPTVTSSTTSLAGNMFRRRIQSLIAEDSFRESVGLQISSDQSMVLLCGHPSMIKESTNVLKERGMRKHRRRTPGHILTERYF